MCVFFVTLWPDIARMGRVTSDVFSGEIRRFNPRNSALSLYGAPFKSHVALFVSHHWAAFLMFSSCRRAMGLFMDVVWYDLNRILERGRRHL